MSVAKFKGTLPFEIYQPSKKIPFLKIGIYGDPGVGKTTLAATAPNPLFLNCEAGEVALRNKDVDVVRVEHFEQMQPIMHWLEQNAGNPDFYQTIVVDSLTELSKRAMDMVLAAEKRDMPHQGDWGRSMEYTRRVVRRMRDMDMHTVFILGSVFREDESTGMAERMPNLPGKLAPEVSGYFDILGYLTMERVKPGEYARRLRVQPSPKWRAKDRTNTLGAYVEQDQLNLTGMLTYINGKEQHAVVTDENVLPEN